MTIFTKKLILQLAIFIIVEIFSKGTSQVMIMNVFLKE